MKFGEWQPMETAPKDGTAILAYGEDEEGARVFAVVFWDEDIEWWMRDWDGWPCDDPGSEFHGWMLLPPPPGVGS